jgi:hypothetical protein
LDAGDKRDALQDGRGLTVNMPAAEADVVQAVEEVAQNGIIRGTKEYNKDEYVTGAVATTTSTVFQVWKDGGKVFYKIRTHAIDPRNFKNGGDVGTLAVRYVVRTQTPEETSLRIDAVFVEDFRHTVHQSEGTVESAEYKDIQEHLDALELMKKETAEGERDRREHARREMVAQTNVGPPTTAENMTGYLKRHAHQSSPEVPEQAPGQSLQEYVQVLRRQAERLVKAPGSSLKSAPFRSATSLTTLPSGTEVLILITTPYWYGVETHDGQHGWISRNDLEELP